MATSTIFQFPLHAVDFDLSEVAERLRAANSNVRYLLLGRGSRSTAGRGYVEFYKPCRAAAVAAAVNAALGATRLSAEDVASRRAGQRVECLSAMHDAFKDRAEMGEPPRGCWREPAFPSTRGGEIDEYDVVADLAKLVSEQPAALTAHAALPIAQARYDYMLRVGGDFPIGAGIAAVARQSVVGSTIAAVDAPLIGVSALWDVAPAAETCFLRHKFMLERTFNVVTAITLSAQDVSDAQWHNLQASLVIGGGPTALALHPLVGISLPEARAARVPRGRELAPRTLMWDMEHAPFPILALQFHQVQLYVEVPYMAGTKPPTFHASISGVNVYGPLFDKFSPRLGFMWATLKLHFGLCSSDPDSTYVVPVDARPMLEVSTKASQTDFVGVEGATSVTASITVPNDAVRDFALALLGGDACDDGATIKVTRVRRREKFCFEVPITYLASLSVYEVIDRLAGMRIKELALVSRKDEEAGATSAATSATAAASGGAGCRIPDMTEIEKKALKFAKRCTRERRKMRPTLPASDDSSSHRNTSSDSSDDA